MTDQDTSPMIRARRIARQVRIQEINDPPSTLFDVTVEYPSTALPEWFAGLQAIVEDEMFTSLTINLQDRVRYRITIVGTPQESEVTHGGVCVQCERSVTKTNSAGLCEGCAMEAEL